MLNELDPFDFTLALKLGMTVEEMSNKMGNDEYLMWRAYFVWLAAQDEDTWSEK